MKIPPFALIITAAGSSTRFNKNVKKEFLTLEDGHSVLYKATEPFYELPGLAAVVVTCKKDAEDETIVALEDLAEINTIPTLFIEGGKTRQESIHKGLKMLKEINIPFHYVAIHDGARPYINPSLIINILATAYRYSGAVPALPITDSIRRINTEGNIVETIDRSGLVSVQTPQIFEFELLLDAYNKAKNNLASDDSQLYLEAGYNVAVCPGDINNKKITFDCDIPNIEEQVETYIKNREEGRLKGQKSRKFREFLHKRDN